MKTKIVPIKDCAEVLPGFSIKTAVTHDPEGTHQIIIAKHLSESGPYNYDPEHELRIKPTSNVEKYRVAPGNILFMSRGTMNRAILLESIAKPTIATASFYILKCKKMVAPGFLTWYLNQEPLQLKISEIRSGAGTPFVPRVDFSQIQIVLPPVDIQQNLAKTYSLMSMERILVNKMSEKVEQKHKLLGRKIIQSLMHKALTKE